MTSTRRVTRMLTICAATTAMTIVTAVAALAYPAPPDPDPAILTPPPSVTTASSHTLQWALAGLSAFLLLVLIAMASAIVISHRRHRGQAPEFSPMSIPPAPVPAARTPEPSPIAKSGSPAQPKR